jgi:alpha-D-ribose 1-methylphosphonate 5-triphosphate diphosphatase
MLTNARLVLQHSLAEGALVLADGRIEDVLPGKPGAFPTDKATDCQGDFLLPGLVDLHSDSLERQCTPRPGVLWPDTLAAAVANDRLLLSQGVTTVLDSLSTEAFPDGPTRRAVYASCLEAVAFGAKQGLFLAEHFLHLRSETADQDAVCLAEPVMDSPLLRLVSLMDHTPGQRQYRDIAVYRRHYGNGNWSEEAFAAIQARLCDNQRRYAGPHRQRIVALARERGLPLASHDDATSGHVDQAHGEGVALCEFPTTLEAARRAREHGLLTVMGAPNIVLGGSHAGNVSALEVLRAGALAILSSDYYPPALLAAPFVLARQGVLPLPEAVGLVTSAPAAAVGFTGRGVLAPGGRADIVRVRLYGEFPVVMGVWVAGNRVG